MILVEANLFFNLSLMIQIVREGVVNLGRGQMRVALEDFVHCVSLFVLPGDEAHPNARASKNRVPSVHIRLLLDVGMWKSVNRHFSHYFRTHLDSTLAIFEWQEGKASFSIELLLHGKL